MKWGFPPPDTERLHDDRHAHVLLRELQVKDTPDDGKHKVLLDVCIHRAENIIRRVVSGF